MYDLLETWKPVCVHDTAEGTKCGINLTQQNFLFFFFIIPLTYRGFQLPFVQRFLQWTTPFLPSLVDELFNFIHNFRWCFCFQRTRRIPSSCVIVQNILVFVLRRRMSVSIPYCANGMGNSETCQNFFLLILKNIQNLFRSPLKIFIFKKEVYICC